VNGKKIKTGSDDRYRTVCAQTPEREALIFSGSGPATLPGKKEFISLKKAYKKSWDISLQLTKHDGSGGNNIAHCEFCGLPECREIRKLVITEALRWGEPVIKLCAGRHFIWAVPVMFNREVLGGIIAEVPEDTVFPDNTGKASLDIVKASADLMRLAGGFNLTNMDLLESRQAFNKNEEFRAHSIHYFKALGISGIREMYSQIEPALLTAIRHGDKIEARGQINNLLTAIMHKGQGNFEHIKGQFLELVITMYRTAVELGGAADTLLGKNYASLVELSKIKTEEDLSFWLTGTLDIIMDSIRIHSLDSKPFQLQTACEYMKEHLSESITRDDAARKACMSAAHFSRQFKKYYKCGFSHMLNKLRIERASELLINTGLSIAEIAQNSGFNDQSYLNKVFLKLMQKTPQQYRLTCKK
jgi:AraC-like DNA-binding protein